MSLGEQGSIGTPLRGSRAWVVGCGLLGRHLQACAREAGMQVLGIDCELAADVQGDASDPAVLADARARLEPEFIFCCVATHGGDEAAYRATYLGLPAALQVACPSALMLFCSSSSVYAGQGGGEVSESTACQPASVRAGLLLEAEAAVRAAGGVVARMVPLYGGGRCELLRGFVRREPELPGADERWLNYVHAEDAARAMLHLASMIACGECPKVVNVCAESFTKGAAYDALSRTVGMPRVGEVREGGRRGVSDQRVSSALLRSLGWQPQVDFFSWAAEYWQMMK